MRNTLVPFVLASLLLVGAGCKKEASVDVSADASADVSADAGAAARANADASARVAADVCGNPYYPFKEGLSITYGISSTDGTSSPDYTMVITDVTGTTAQIEARMSNGVTGKMTADCAGGTVTLGGDFDMGSVAQAGTVKTEVVSTSGTFMAANVDIGSTWESQQQIKTEATSGVGAGMGPVTTDVKTVSRAAAKESVTVGAGTYDAVKVEQTRTVTVNMDEAMTNIQLPPGMKIPTPAPTTVTTTEWWVKGIGLVKSQTLAGGVTTTVEAKAVSGN